MHITHIAHDHDPQTVLCGATPEPQPEGASTAICSTCYIKAVSVPPETPNGE